MFCFLNVFLLLSFIFFVILILFLIKFPMHVFSSIYAVKSLFSIILHCYSILFPFLSIITITSILNACYLRLNISLLYFLYHSFSIVFYYYVLLYSFFRKHFFFHLIILLLNTCVHYPNKQPQKSVFIILVNTGSRGRRLGYMACAVYGRVNVGKGNREEMQFFSSLLIIHIEDDKRLEKSKGLGLGISFPLHRLRKKVGK